MYLLKVVSIEKFESVTFQLNMFGKCPKQLLMYEKVSFDSKS